jgi:hypothetical protein
MPYFSSIHQYKITYCYSPYLCRWVSHFNEPGWDTGRPWLSESSTEASEVESLRKRHDNAFRFAKGLDLAPVDKSLKLCNGLDAVNRIVFDHFHPWVNGGKTTYTLNLEGGGLPYFVGPVTIYGGRPESVDPDEVIAYVTDKEH